MKKGVLPENAMAARIDFFVVSIALLLIINTSASLELGKLHFTYTGATGPNRWGSLDPTYSTCSHGKLQSPINIVNHETFIDKNLKPLRSVYLPSNATLVDRRFNVGISCKGNAGELVVDGKSYYLKQIHWHSPSEHQIDGVEYAAELHLVHEANDGNLSVVGVLYKLGRADPILAEMNSKLGKLAREAEHLRREVPEIPIGIFNFKQLKRKHHKYYRYVGSLTTPPCSENVIWHILGEVRSISAEQVGALRAPLDSGCKRNSRPVQQLNGRHVELYI